MKTIENAETHSKKIIQGNMMMIVVMMVMEMKGDGDGGDDGGERTMRYHEIRQRTVPTTTSAISFAGRKCRKDSMGISWSALNWNRSIFFASSAFLHTNTSIATGCVDQNKVRSKNACPGSRLAISRAQFQYEWSTPDNYNMPLTATSQCIHSGNIQTISVGVPSQIHFPCSVQKHFTPTMSKR